MSEPGVPRGQPGIRCADLYASADFTCRLGFYDEGSAQPFHSHPTPTLSLLLSGSIHEVTARHEMAAGPASMSIKPADVSHSNAYGRNGALILSIAILNADFWAAAAAPQEWGWEPLGRGDYGNALASISASGRWCDAAFELLALGIRPTRRAGTAPRWLREVKEQLSDEPHLLLSTVAKQAHVHPVYLARSFRHWYGISPSAFRLGQRTSAAVGATLWSDRAASEIAHDVGFADQSHMARSIRRATGHTLSQLRMLATRSFQV